VDSRWMSAVATSFATMLGIGSAIVDGFDVKRWNFMADSLVFASIGTVGQLIYLYITEKRFQHSITLS